MADLRTRPWEELSDSGVLWAINRVLFHPRGYALTVTYDERGQAIGWFIQGDGNEVWSFSPDEDDPKFAAFKDTMEHVVQECSREPGHSGPCNGWPCESAKKNNFFPGDRVRVTIPYDGHLNEQTGKVVPWSKLYGDWPYVVTLDTGRTLGFKRHELERIDDSECGCGYELVEDGSVQRKRYFHDPDCERA